MRHRRWLLFVLAVAPLLPLAPGAEAQSVPPLTEQIQNRVQTYDASRPADRPLGFLSANPYLAGSTTNPTAGFRYESPANPYGPYGSPYARDGALNPFTTGGAKIVGQDGTYLGRLNANPYDSESVANPYGRYGSPYSPTSVNNPYSRYGSPYSTLSATNPHALQPPVLVRPRR